MATLESVFSKNLYTTAYDYTKYQGVNGVKPRTYDGTVVLAAGITQKNGNTFPLVHAKDIQLGQEASERLTDKLAAYDAILREIYGRAPSLLANLTSSTTGHGSQATPGDNMDSLSDLAYILNDRTETVDERIKDLRMFKTFTIGAQGTSTDDTTTGTVSTNLVADSNADTLTIKSENQWIILKATTSSDTFTIGHYKKAFDPTTATADLNSSGTFAIPVLGYDAAGHIISKLTTTYTLPYNYKTIKVGAQSSAKTNLTAATGDLIAANQIDEITFITANKWIHLAPDTTNNIKSVKIAHLVQTINTSVDTIDFDNSGTFTVPYLTYDEAGHVTAEKTTTYTIQDGYKTIKLSNTTTTVTELTTNTTDVVAESRIDALTFAAGNKWIRFAGDNSTSDKKIKIAHLLSALASGAHASSWSLNAQTPNFGSTFNLLIPSISFTTDEAGHVTAYTYSSSTQTVTIPQGSISTANNNAGNVLVGLSLTQSSMAFVRTFAYINDLALTNYTYAVTNITLNTRPSGKTTTHTIVATDTLNHALAKLQSYAIANHNAIDQEITDRGTAITNLINGASSGYTTLKDLETKIKAAQQTADDHIDVVTGNPHHVTASDIGLGNVSNKNLNNVDNAQQIKALSQLATTDANTNKVAVWTAKNTLAVGHQLLCDVPEDAVFTDHTYTTGTASESGLTKLYTTLSGNTSKTDGTLTASALNTVLNTTKNDAITTILDNFDISLKMPTTVTWSVENDKLSYDLGDYAYIDSSVIVVYKLNGEDVEQFDLSETVTTDDKFKLSVTRTLTIGTKTYDNTWLSEIYTV